METVGDFSEALQLRAWSGLAEAYLGDHQGATETLQTAAERARQGRYDETLAEALILWGLADLLDGHPRALRPGLERALEGLELIPQHGNWLQGFSFEIVAALHLAVGEIDGALEYSTKGLRIMETIPSPWWPERSYFTHAQILRALSRDEEADEYLQRAYDRVMLVAGKTRNEKLRRSWLENVEVNREILAECAQRGIGHA
jgi:tetratricopeptide (TPR) repeat protein